MFSPSGFVFFFFCFFGGFGGATVAGSVLLFFRVAAARDRDLVCVGGADDVDREMVVASRAEARRPRASTSAAATSLSCLVVKGRRRC
jgi:hypothetical protein